MLCDTEWLTVHKFYKYKGFYLVISVHPAIISHLNNCGVLASSLVRRNFISFLRLGIAIHLLSTY